MDFTQPVKYIDAAQMFKETLFSINKGKMTEKLGEMILLLANKYTNHRMFVRYTHMREELISNGVVACVRAFQSFRPMRNNILERDADGVITKSERVEWDCEVVDYNHNIHNNAFAFFTTCITNANIQYLKKYYQHKNLVNALLVEAGEAADYGYEDYMKSKQASTIEDDFDADEIYNADKIVVSEPDEESVDIDSEDIMEAATRDDAINIDSIAIEEVEDSFGITW